MNVHELLAEVATAPIVKRAITNHTALNEAYDYGSAFSRGMRIDLRGLTILLISGTASIDDQGRTVHVGDLRAQVRRTYDNITKLLASEAAWHAAEAALQTHGGFGYAKEYDVERKWRETRLMQIAPISTNLILAFLGEHVLGMPRSY